MDDTPETDDISRKLPSGTPKWVVVVACLVSGVVVPAALALSPHISEMIKGAIESKKSQADNERTALGTVLSMLETNTKQVYVLSAALETEQQGKKELTARVSDLEKVNIINSQALKDCEARLKLGR